jgi:SsrA-binding protein
MSKNKPEKESFKSVASNRRASMQYEILETLEAGIVLTGPEVKSLRNGKANLQDGFARVDGEQAFLWNVHISPYAMGSTHVQQEPLRTRKLLLNHQEIMRWLGKTTTKGLTIIPLEIYFNKKNIAKVKLGLCKSKKGPDRREDIKKRALGRELQRDFAGKYKLR